MIEFVDLETGKLFHIEPNDPYTFWFDQGQSINLNYVKPICFISDQATVHISCNSPIFSLLKQLDETFPQWWENHQTIINSKAYVDLTELKIGPNETYILTGYPWRNNTMPVGEYLYVYIIYVLASSRDSGQFRDKFKINDDEYEVGADFYAPNEILKSNLENFDISIPESIQKAIYDVDVHEESNDNITLNRKYKELLMNYWDIVANKGSYKSLINSLAWFEWGDLVRIEEVWKRYGRNMEDYFHTELNRPLDPEFISQLRHNAKTTYIGLYMALSKFTYNWKGKMEYRDHVAGMGPLTSTSKSSISESDYEDAEALDQLGWDSADVTPINVNDPNLLLGTIWTQIPDPQGNDRDVVVYAEHIPNLQLISTKWGLLELCLKMTLLGNFYSSYFMPIHMDLIHSTVEAWVFGYTQKLLNTTGFERIHTASFGNAFDLQYDTHCKIMHVDTRTYSTTMFKGMGKVFGLNEDTSGMERTPWDTSVNPATDNFNPLKYFYGGASGRINCSAVIPAEDEYDYMVAQRCAWARSSTDYGELNCGEGSNYDQWFNVWLKPVWNAETEQYEHRFNFALGFREAGHYKLGVEFTLSSGNTYNRTFEVDVEDDVSNHIDLYKVIPLEWETRKDMEDIYDGDRPRPWMHCFQMAPGPNDPELENPEDPNWPHSRRLPNWAPTQPWEYVGYIQHAMFIQTLGEENGIGLNHTVIFEALSGDTIDFEIDNQTISIALNIGADGVPSIISNSNLGEYVWIYNEYTPTHVWRFVGISRKFDYERVGNNTGLIQSITGFSVGLLDPVIEERFHPFMYQLEKFENWTPQLGPTTIKSGDVIYMDPVLKYSTNHDDFHDYSWVFLNKSTGTLWGSNMGLVSYHSINNLNKEVYEPVNHGGMEATMALPYNQYNPASFQLTRLEPGYYNIRLWYKKSGEWLNYEYNNAFLVGRK